MRFGKKQQYDLAMRVYHYSNASIKRPNSGVNLAMASFGVDSALHTAPLMRTQPWRPGEMLVNAV